MVPWALGLLTLLAAGCALRRLLRLHRPEAPRRAGLPRLTPERELVYNQLHREIEAHSGMVGVSLNEAIEQYRAGRPEHAWSMVRLSLAEWRRLAETLTSAHAVVGRHLSATVVVVPVRGKSADYFKTRLMADSARLHELLDQLVFRSNLRFQLHLRFLRRAVETLTMEFARTCRTAERANDGSPEIWSRLDHLFHDFDLVAKETLLASRAFLACLPDTAVEQFAGDLIAALERPAQSTPSMIED